MAACRNCAADDAAAVNFCFSFTHALAPIVFALALAASFACGYLVRRYEDRLTASAERALPGPLVAEVDKKGP
jgi:hypothetical protein